MKMFRFFEQSMRVCTSLAVFVVIQSCGKDRLNKPEPTVITPQLVAEVDCGDSLKNGESRTISLFKSEFAPVGQSCKSIQFEGQETCAQGTTSTTESGSRTCEETTLTSMEIVGNVKDLELGQSLALSVEGLDQRGGKVSVPNALAKWTTNNDFISVSSAGVVSGKLALKDVVVTAKIGKITAQYKLNIVGKRCGEIPDSVKRSFSRYDRPRVAFGQKCETREVEATCTNGEFVFALETSESCEVAKLSRLEVAPAALFLNPGQSANVELFLVDDIGTKIPAAVGEAQWTLPSTGELQVTAGQIMLVRALEKPSEIKITSNGLTASLWVSALADAPTLHDFEEKALVLKAGDEKVLKVRATGAVDLNQINWESSDPTLVSVSNGIIKALRADGEATITGTLNGKSIEARVRVEAELKLTRTAVTYTGTQQGKVHPLTQDKTSLLPAFIVDLNLPKGRQPALEGVTEGCKFNLRFNRGKWELDAEIDESFDVIPANCEANVVAETEAGQKLSENFKVPVDYNKVTLIESVSTETAEGTELGRIQLKMSSSYSVDSVTVKTLVEGMSKCEWKVVPDSNSYKVVLTNKDTDGCAGQIIVKMPDANDGLVLTFNEFIVSSKTRTFEDYCKNPNSDGIKATVDALRKEFGPTLGCDKLAALMRSRSLGSLASNKSFPLVLDKRNLFDLSPLARFVGLRELSLAGNAQLSDIRPLSALKHLKSLNLKFTAVKDLSPIEKHELMSDLRLPKDLKVQCRSEITNPEITKICE